MNKCYRSVFNDALGVWVAVSEICSARGKRSSAARIAATMVAATGMAGSMSAMALNECGPASQQSATASSVTCSTGDYGSGITYADPGLVLTLQAGSTVGTDSAPSTGVNISGAGPSGNYIFSDGDAHIVVDASETQQHGLNAMNDGTGGSFVTTSQGTTVESRGATGAYGIQARADGGGEASVNNGGSVTTTGVGSIQSGNHGVYAQAVGGGRAFASNRGEVSTLGVAGHGVYVTAMGGGSAIARNSGNVDVRGLGSSGVVAFAVGAVDVPVSSSANAQNDGYVVVHGDYANGGAVGVLASSVGGGDASVLNTGRVETHGVGSQGVRAAVYAAGPANTWAENTGEILTTGDGAAGVVAVAGSENQNSAHAKTSTGGVVTTKGDSAIGVLGFGEASQNVGAVSAEVNDSQVSTEGIASHGAAAVQDGLGNAYVGGVGSTVVTRGDDAYGAYARINNPAVGAAHARVNIGGVSINGNSGLYSTSGARAHGMYAYNHGRGNAVLSIWGDAVVTASGVDADGARAQSLSGNYDVKLVDGRVSGGSGTGAAIHTLAVNGGTVDIFAAGTVDGTASGVAIRDGDAGTDNTGGNAVVTTAGTVIGDAVLGVGDDTLKLLGGRFDGSVYGDGQAAGANDGNDTFNWTGGTLAGGYYGQNGSDTALISAAAYDGGNVLDGGDDVSAADGMVDRLRLQGVNATAGGAQLINWERIDLDGTKLTLSGAPLVVGAGNDAAGSPLGLHIAPISSVSMGPNTTAFAITGDVHNSGTIDLRSPAGTPGNMLTVNGNYAGNLGVVQLNTVLGDDTSATDKLQVNGNTSGTTRLLVANAGGTGGNTVNGIRVVQVAGTSSQGDFALAAPVQAGAYEYLLQRGGRTDGDANSFYLKSNYQQPPVDPVDPVKPVKPVGPTAKPVVPAQPEVVRPAVPGYVLGQAASLELGQGLLGTLHERASEQQTLKWDYCGCDAKAPDDQAWGRLNAQRLDLDGERQFGYRQDLQYAQFGKDLSVRYSEDAGDKSRTHTGISAGYGRTGVDFNDRRRGDAGLGYATGNMTGQMGTVGLYHTRYADNGSYLDLVGQLHAVRNAYKDKYSGEATQKGWGGGLSAEVGRPWQIGESQWLIEPQAQLSYQATRYGQFEDKVSTIDGQTAQSLRARVGGRLAWNDKANRADQLTRTNTFYMKANLLHEFKDQSTATIGDTRVSEQWGKQTWAEVGVGAQIPLTKASYLYGGAQYQQSITGKSRQGVSGQVGLRVAFE